MLSSVLLTSSHSSIASSSLSYSSFHFITSSAFGETNLRVQTADGVREVQNRRVEITYGPGSGQ